MAQRTDGIYRLTQIPRLYAAFQRMLGGEATRREIVSRYLKPVAGMRVLDFGCGPASILGDLGPVQYTGIDLNAEHIAAARAAHGDAGTFLCGDLDGLDRQAKGPFDLVMCIGVLHHLDDAQVSRLCERLRGRLAPGGRLVAIDPAFVDRQNPIAYLLARSDSGRNVRRPEDYAALARPHFDSLDVELRHDLLRVPYTHCVMTGAIAGHVVAG